MTSRTLAQSYMKKACARIDVLALLHKKKAYSDVIREAQEIVELSLKGMLRFVGIEPPKIHDVGGLLLEHSNKYPKTVSRHLARLARISKILRRERELAFYGDVDFIPTEEYTDRDARKAMDDARFVVATVKAFMDSESRG